MHGLIVLLSLLCVWLEWPQAIFWLWIISMPMIVAFPKPDGGRDWLGPTTTVGFFFTMVGRLLVTMFVLPNIMNMCPVTPKPPAVSTEKSEVVPLEKSD